MKKFVWIAVLTLAARIAQANFDGSDNFPGTTISTNWGSPLILGDAQYRQDDRLYFSSAGATNETGNVFVLPWLLNAGSYVADWHVVVDVYRNVSLTGTQSVTLSLNVTPWENMNTYSKTYSVMLDRILAEPIWDFAGFSTNLADENGHRVWEARANSLTLTGSVAVSFDANTKVLSAWYDPDGSANGYQWSFLDSVGIAGSGGVTNVNWGMTTSNEFGVRLLASADRGSVVHDGEAWFDNFRAYPQAIPEPGTAWLLGAGVGLLVVHRKLLRHR